MAMNNGKRLTVYYLVGNFESDTEQANENHSYFGCQQKRQQKEHQQTHDSAVVELDLLNTKKDYDVNKKL